MSKTSLDAHVESCDLCIVGAGVSGLNALYVASGYLPENARVIMIDRNGNCGGMWNETYDYARLHQPHPTFTVGDIAWNWNKPRHHLASRNEVLSHFEHCAELVRQQINLVELYGHQFNHCEEIVGSGNQSTSVRCSVTDSGGKPLVIQARRLIRATGFDIPVLDPLQFSSNQVVSTTPQMLMQDIPMDSSRPVYVVGGGKTGMDTVMTLAQHRPASKVTLVNGKGTVFANRGVFAPTGARRWWGGKLIMRSFAEVAMRFDGNNEEQVYDFFRQSYAISPDGTGEHFFFGLQSEAENTAIVSGLKAIIKDYLSDVVDSEDGPQLMLQSGRHIAVEPGSVIVNCTGHILKRETPYEPYLSEHGAVLTITTRSAIHVLTSVSSYFLTHLFFLDKLPHAQLYAIDFDSLIKKGRKVWQMTAITISFMNVIVLINSLPFKVIDGCGLDLDKWFPLHRRAGALINVKLHQKRYLSHCRTILDRIANKYAIRCEVLK